jgi:beta-glucosidase
MKTFSLKDGFLLGSASAATQVEGGDLDHSWMDWAHKGRITDGTSPARANDHVNRWQEDAALMRDLGMQVCRLGVEWARIEPQEGVFDEAAIEHYIREIELLQSYGMKVLVTLHHFTNPMWFENKGAFAKAGNISCFIRFVTKVVRSFGALVNEYITINEPNVYATNGYYFGSWPPGLKSFSATVKVMSGMAAAHIRAYELIHSLRGAMGLSDTKVSFANHMRVFAPENPENPAHKMYAKLTERLFQGSLTLALCTGVFQFPLQNIFGAKRGKYADFHALNYYTRSSVSGLRDGVKRGAPVNDLGWEIYPPGIVECARKLHNIAQLPIYVTENGTCDNTDSFRSLYLYEHLKALSESDLPIQRYYHWCFCDNFEWVEGESARFGIIHIDYETQKRTIKGSGEFLRDVIKAHGVTDALYDQYVKGQEYPRTTSPQ